MKIRTSARAVVVVVGLVTALGAGTAQAAPTLKADCAASFGIGKGWLFDKNSSDLCFTGSTAKIMTLHVALQARKAGLISDADQLVMTPQGLVQGCTCLANYATSPIVAKADREAFAQPGETLGSLADVFASVAASAAEPTVAIAEHVAAAAICSKKTPKQPASDCRATTQTESNALEGGFIKLMNEAGKKMGLTKTTFVNEHGGDDGVSTYAGGKSKTTARELIKVWKNASESNADFLPSLGQTSHPFSTTHTDSTGATVTRQYDVGFGRAYYPGVVADKNGGSSGCGFCLISQARRLGQNVIASYFQRPYNDVNFSENYDDARELFKHAFAKILSPKTAGNTGDEGPKAKSARLECVTNGCVAALITPEKKLKVIAIGKGKNGKPKFTSSKTMSFPNVKSVDIEKLEGFSALANVFVTLTRSGDSYHELSTWQLKTVDGKLKPVHLNTLYQAQVPSLRPPEGTFGTLARFGADRFAVLARGTDGKLGIKVYKTDTEGGIKHLASATTPYAIGATQGIAAAGDGSGVKLLTAAAWQGAPLAGQLLIQHWTFNPDAGTLTAGTLHQSGLPSVKRVTSAARYDGGTVIASVGTTGAGRLFLHYFPKGSETPEAVGPLDNGLTTASVSIARGTGQFVATKDSGRLAVSVFDHAPYSANANNQELARLGRSTGASGGQIEVAEAFKLTGFAGSHMVGIVEKNDRYRVIGYKVG